MAFFSKGKLFYPEGKLFLTFFTLKKTQKENEKIIFQESIFS